MLDICVVCKKRIIKPSKKTLKLKDFNRICANCCDSIPVNNYLRNRLSTYNSEQVINYLEICKSNQEIFQSNFTFIHRDIIIEFDFFRVLMRTNKFPDVIDLKSVLITKPRLDYFRVEKNYEKISDYNLKGEYETRFFRDGNTYVGSSSFDMVIRNSREVMFFLTFTFELQMPDEYKGRYFTKAEFKESCVAQAERYARIIHYNIRFTDMPIPEKVICETGDYGDYKQYDWDKILSLYDEKLKAVKQLRQIKDELYKNTKR